MQEMTNEIPRYDYDIKKYALTTEEKKRGFIVILVKSNISFQARTSKEARQFVTLAGKYKQKSTAGRTRRKQNRKRGDSDDRCIFVYFPPPASC